MHQLFATNQQWKRTRSTFTFTCDSHLLSRVCKVCSRNYIVSKLTVLSFQARLDHSFKRKFRCLNAQVQKCCRQTSIPRNYFPNWFRSSGYFTWNLNKIDTIFSSSASWWLWIFFIFSILLSEPYRIRKLKKAAISLKRAREWKLKFEPQFSLFFERKKIRMYLWSFTGELSVDLWRDKQNKRQSDIPLCISLRTSNSRVKKKLYIKLYVMEKHQLYIFWLALQVRTCWSECGEEHLQKWITSIQHTRMCWCLFVLVFICVGVYIRAETRSDGTHTPTTLNGSPTREKGNNVAHDK